ncbi:transporter substrate-binding domain-containing protein, partial [Streptococcus pyogenes]
SFVLTACSSTASNSSENTVTEWNRVKEAGVLKVATPATLFPTSYYNEDKELVGYEIDMMNEIGKRLDLKIEYQEIG